MATWGFPQGWIRDFGKGLGSSIHVGVMADTESFLGSFEIYNGVWYGYGRGRET